MSENSMVVIDGIRYNREDARQLGLLNTATEGAPATGKGRGRSGRAKTSGRSAGQAPPAGTDASDIDELPAESASKAAWLEYALAHGQTEESVDGLTKPQIAALFKGADDEDSEDDGDGDEGADGEQPDED
jgi:hypothetical protein